mgnify:CR=1 FL=1
MIKIEEMADIFLNSANFATHIFSNSSYVLKLKVPEEKSLNDLLKDFLNSKTCRCGKVNPVTPTVKNIGQYVFLEIDRTVYSGEIHIR